MIGVQMLEATRMGASQFSQVKGASRNKASSG
jgi:hypothetical protein